MDYCDRSASPVGRYLLDLHGESADGYAFSDALCNALQVINHLQDCKDDYLALDRVYLSGDWMRQAGTDVTALAASGASLAMRRVLDRHLDGVETLLVGARKLPAALKSRRLAMESAAIVRIAERLVALLRARDPIAGRVELSRPRFLACCLEGAWQALIR